MKLTHPKLLRTLEKLNDGKQFIRREKISDIGKFAGRPRKPFAEWEINLVKSVYEKYRVSADTLQRLIDRDFQKHIGHNRIHQILIFLGYAKKKRFPDKRKKKWKRYKRRHSLTAVHINWYYFKGIFVFAVEDDASRKLLALVEAKRESTNDSIVGMEIALEHG